MATKEKEEPMQAEKPKVEPKPEAYTITVVIEGGNRMATRVEGSLAKAKVESKSIANAGLDIDADGVFTHYPAHRIIRVTVTAATE